MSSTRTEVHQVLEVWFRKITITQKDDEYSLLLEVWFRKITATPFQENMLSLKIFQLSKMLLLLQTHHGYREL
ncbi:hypothetical protein F0562_022731 [Nyssa sinensis]|uniref:Uncharacterized protein n=1 Tax=Nyssa sinensis TaxID=561372 RepID=A0A5J5BFS1_9ASTE|nr:hypothetical protein F0562_022731 [Nyssa sinensis]